MKKRLLAMMMAFVMAMSLLPMSALAVNVEQSPETSVSTEASSPVQITKQVSGGDGNYTLTMDAYVTGKVTTTAPTPLDIVLVLDVSGSMADDISIVTSSEYRKTALTNASISVDFWFGDGEYYYSEDGSTFYKITEIEYKPLSRKYIYYYEGGSYTSQGILTVPDKIYELSVENTTESKMKALQTAVNNFINETATKNAQIADTNKMNRISIVKFAGTKTDQVGDQKYKQDGHSYNYSQIVKNLTEVNTTGQAELKSAVNALTAAGATSADYGMELAQTVLSSSSGGRNKVVIFFTDGEPNHGNGFSNSVAADTVNTAKELKDSGTKIYTIGVLKGADPKDTGGNINKYMNAVSSNYPAATATGNNGFKVTLGKPDKNGGYYKAATNADDLNTIFGNINEEITANVTADAASVLSDTLSQYVKFADDPNVVVKKIPASGKGETPAFKDEDATVISNPNYTISGKTITVTGFDYSANHVYKDNQNVWHGSKLVVSFDVVPDASASWKVGKNIVPTNVAAEEGANNAGLSYGNNSSEKTELTKSPEIEVTAYGVNYHGNDSDGGTQVTDTQGYLPGTTVTVKENTFTKAGYEFTEWNSQANGEGTIYKGTFTMPGKDVDLYAQWREEVPQQPAVTVVKELYGKWIEDEEGKRIDTETNTYSPGDRVVYKITATVNADNVKSFTIEDEGGNNLNKDSFIAYSESGKDQFWRTTNTNYVYYGASATQKGMTETTKYFGGTEGSKTEFTDGNIKYDYVVNDQVTVSGTANIDKDTTITVYYFATVADVTKTGEKFDNEAVVTVSGTEVDKATAQSQDITLPPYTITFVGEDNGKLSEKTYKYNDRTDQDEPAYPVEDGSKGKLQRLKWYEDGDANKRVYEKGTIYNENITFKAVVTDVMKVEKTLITKDTSNLQVGSEVTYQITATVYDASLTSITVTEEPGPGLIGGKLTCDGMSALNRITLEYKDVFGAQVPIRFAAVDINGNTATVTPVLGSSFKSGDTITFTYTATLGIANTIITDDNGTRNTVTLTNNKGETATDTTEPFDKVGLPTIDVDVEKTVTKINGEDYKGEDKVSKGDTVTYEITVTNNSSVPVFGVPVIEKPNNTLTNGHFVPEEGTITIADLTKIDLSDISALIRNLMSGKSTLNVALGSNANLVLTADWSKVNPKELLEALTTIRNIKDLDSLLSALDVLLTKPDVTAGSIEEAIGNIENYMAALLQKYGFLNGTLYVDGECADVAILGRIDKSDSATLTYTATVDSCDKDGKVINTVCVGGDKATAKIDAQTYTVTYTDGVTDEEVFPDQVYTVISGAKTPDFDGTPARDGYAFTGWNPDPKTVPTVTEDATYTATWTDEIVPVLFYISGLDTEGYIVENPVPSIPNLSVKDGYVYLNAMVTATQWDAETQEIKGNDEVAQWLEKAISDFDSDAAYTLNDLINAANARGAGLSAADFAGWVYQSVHWEGNEGWHVHIALTKPRTPIENMKYAYQVEYYTEEPDGTYKLKETTLPAGFGAEGEDVSVTPDVDKYASEGFAYDPYVEGTLTEGQVTKITKGEDDKPQNILTLKLYYSIDTKGNSTDPENTGDGIPDKYQALVLFKSKDEAKGTVTGDGIVQVFTFSKQEGDKTVYLKNGTVYPDMTKVTATAKSGYKFDIWTKDNGTTSVKPDTAIENVAGGTIIKFYANWASTGNNNNTGGGGSSKPPVLNKEDHYAYIVGYPDGTVKPQGNITRAEVATIFFRMLTDDSRNEFWSQTNSYRDVSEGQWFNNAISTLANAGILSGYPDGTFRPNAPITRAEFTKIAASFFERVEYTIDNPFNDVDDDDWFYKFVMAAYEGGLITGYPEGDFRPNANISRAESVTIVNRTLERAPDADHFLKDMIVWPDNAENAWYYEAVQEATNSHEYVVKGTGTNKYEEWTKILEVRDWPALEKEWSNANSATGGEVVK